MEAIKIKGETVLLQDNVLLLSFDDKKKGQTVAVMCKIKADPESIYNAAAAMFETHPPLISLFTLAASYAFQKLHGEGKL
jgi:hypothetical protein